MKNVKKVDKMKTDCFGCPSLSIDTTYKFKCGGLYSITDIDSIDPRYELFRDYYCPCHTCLVKSICQNKRIGSDLCPMFIEATDLFINQVDVSNLRDGRFYKKITRYITYKGDERTKCFHVRNV